MKRRLAALSLYVVTFLILAGCAWKPAEPEPEPKAPEQQAQVEPRDRPVEVHSAVTLKMGPYPAAVWVNWEQDSWLHAYLRVGEEFAVYRFDLPRGEAHKLSISEAERVYRADPQRRLSPDGTRAIMYGKFGPGSFINLASREEHVLDAPGFYASNMFDSWSPDGQHYLVQSIRTDEVPGFYFMDRDGQLSGTWAQPGYHSHLAAWAPESERIAFLSTPLDTKYPHPPDGWEEQPFGPRLGILHVASGEHLGVDAPEGGVFFAGPIWAPDGSTMAVLCGPHEVAKRSGYQVSVLK